jgi:membrane-associated protease RseP (regulator of RpoE activity)
VDVRIAKSDKKTPVKMLIDSGGSDAMWLFEHTKENLITPEKYFVDFLGVGLSGIIYGKRSRIATLELGDYVVKEPTVSFLDSISTQNARRYKARNGSIGSNILKRFKVWIDYPNKKFTIEKNGSLSGGFEYNMSGIEVVYNGKVLIQERVINFGTNYGRNNNSSGSASNSVNLVTSFQFEFKPSFRVNNVLEGSPADLAGIQKNDVILKINGKNAYDFDLEEIIGKFQRKSGAKIKLEIMRNDQIMTFVFRLKKIV